MSRRAFTLVEMLVVIAVLGLLAALLLPAIQKARTLARMRECQSNLHNLGIAANLYHDLHGFYPRGRQPGGWGPLVAILPEMEFQSLYNAANFSFPFHDATNYTVSLTRMTSFLCPSDERIALPGARFERGNYVANTGSGLQPDPNPCIDPSCIFYPTDGVFLGADQFTGGLKQIPRSAIRDGLENTVLFSETLRGDGIDSLPPAPARVQRQYALYGGNVPISDSVCNGPAGYSGWRLSSWTSGSYASGLYNHFLTPNSTTVDCLNFVPAVVNPANGQIDSDLPEQPAGTPVRYARGRVAARSLHPGGANVLYAGGRVTLVSNRIDVITWRGIATRASGEVVQQY